MNKIRRVSSLKTPRFSPPNAGAGFILGIFLWIFAIITFLVVLYVAIFSQNLVFLTKRIFNKNIYPPFWFSAICVIFLFPITILVILGGTFWKMLEEHN